MTEIAKYNGMMSYLTRPPAPKTQVADLVDDLEPGALKDEMKGKFDPDQETYEEYLQRKGLGERPFNASEGGSPLVPKPKPYTLEQFQEKADLYIKGALGGFPKDQMIDLLQKQLDKAEEAGILSREEAINFLNERTQQIKEFIKNNPGEADLSRVKKAIGGGAFVGEELPNNREGFKLIADRDSIKGPLTRGAKKDQYSIRVRDDKTNERYQKYFKDEEKLNKFVEKNSPKEFISADDLRVIANNLKKTLGTLPTQTQVADEAGITIQAVKNRLTEGTDYAKPLTPQEAAKIGGKVAAETKTKGLVKAGDEEGLAKLQRKVDALNKKYNLSDKGVSFNVTKTSSGNFGTTIQYKAGIYRDTLGKTRDTGSLKELEKIMEKFSKTKLFKDYSKAEMFTVGGIKSAIKQLRNAGSKQDLMFEYILKSEQTPTIEELSKKFKISKDLVTKDIKRLYTNIYRRAAGEGAPYLPGNQKTLSNVLEKVTNMDVDLTKDSVINLITDAYGDSEQGDALRSKVRKFYKLQTKIPKEYQKFFSSQLDHIIPLNFLTQIRSDIPAEDLIRINPLPGFLNQRAFKSQLDTAIGTAKRIGDTEAIKAYSELQTFLPEVLGGISKTGKITDFGAETLTEDKSLTKAQQTQTKKIYDSVLKFIDNPKAGPLLEKLGINQETAFDALRGSGQLIRKNIPGFLNTFRRILKENPELRVELGDPYKEIENQYASLLTMSDASPVKEQEKDPLPYEAALPAGVALGKYGPQILNALKGVGKVGLKTVGSLPAAGTFAGMTIKENLDQGKNIADAVVDPLVGIELLLPETVKKLGPLMARAARVSTPVGATITGLGTLKDRTLGMMRDAEALAAMQPNEQQQKLIEEFAAQQYRGYELGGRVGFADGPEDPSKRNFMKIMGGLASLPLVGRFFKIGEKAAPVIDAVKTEAAKGKPEWFDALVNKVIRMGEDVTDRFATVDRETVNQIDIADGETIRVYRNVDEGSVRVEYESPDNMGGDSVDLVYKKPNPDEGNPNPSAEFYATELEPRGIRTGPDDYDVEFDGENYADSVDELMSDTGRLEYFATGKTDMKKIEKSNEKRKKVKAMNESTLEQAEYLETKYGPGPEGPDDY